MSITLRPLTPADESLLWTALYDAIHVLPGAEPASPDIVRQPDLARYVEGWMHRPGDLGFVAEASGETVGAAWVRLWRAESSGYGFVDEATPELSMSVRPGWRGRGIGTALLRQTLAEAARGADAVSLSVSASNSALRLYERFGFRTVRDDDGSRTMIKRLTADP